MDDQTSDPNITKKNSQNIKFLGSHDDCYILTEVVFRHQIIVTFMDIN